MILCLFLQVNGSNLDQQRILFNLHAAVLSFVVILFLKWHSCLSVVYIHGSGMFVIWCSLSIMRLCNPAFKSFWSIWSSSASPNYCTYNTANSTVIGLLIWNMALLRVTVLYGAWQLLHFHCSSLCMSMCAYNLKLGTNWAKVEDQPWLNGRFVLYCTFLLPHISLQPDYSQWLYLYFSPELYYTMSQNQ